MKGLVLGGGFGTRLRPITHWKQKQLIPVANKPMIEYAIDDLREAGITDIGIVYGPNKEQFHEIFGDGKKLGVKITYIEQDYPRGIAHAIIVSEKFLKGEPFVMYLGDNLLKGGIKKFVKDFEASKADASILLTHHDNPTAFGVAEVDAKGDIIKLVEKPKNPKSDLVMIGIYAFREKIYEAVNAIKPSFRNELEITDAVDYLVQKGCQVKSGIVEGWWKDTGKADDLLEANQLILHELKPENKGEIEKGVSLKGAVKIGKGSIIREGTVIKGPVIIGENCDIGPNSYIGPYTSLGNNIKLKNTEIEYSIVMDGSNIHCGKRIVESLIGENCEISSNVKTRPEGHKLIIGENSSVSL
ncbi:Bifunctional protein GlmU [Candidatus Gugararchaeum adminiculabundum]|nr:Bifunctional protein GlmU [Candidatus Gugararchaeum adminiculabundum]